MKNFLAFLMSAILLLTVVSCRNDDDSNNGDTPTISVTGVSFNKSRDTLAIGQTLLLEPIFQPEDATNQNVDWVSNADTIATVVNGTVTGLSLGSARIIVTTQDGNHTGTCQIVVSNVLHQHCNMLVPGWGNSLGTVTRGTQEWPIAGNGITQTWSDAVTATNCDKTTFAGGSTGNFNADCRSNPDFPGDLFSWCAVVRFADVLCPYPWRVPTNEDFRDLDIAMGGTGDFRIDLDFINTNYISRWGGHFSGRSTPNGALGAQHRNGLYWSQTESRATEGHHLYFLTNGYRWAQSTELKHNGLTLRCVR